MKSTSSVALFAAAGLFVGGVAMPSAKAADLGGDCCADLEERVAELEATTARKGNRRVSLTVYGWVNKGVMYWNDGEQSNTYLGVDNTNFATRFAFRGDARVNPNLKAGFSILMDVITGPTTSSVSQKREDAVLTIVNAAGVPQSLTAPVWNDDPIIRIRDANVWLDHTQLGRLTVGHFTSPGPQAIIDLGGISVAASGIPSLVGGGFIFRNSATGAFTSATITNNTDNLADFSRRVDGLRWDSPAIGGFLIGLAAGEAASVDRNSLVPIDAGKGEGPLGIHWSANLRYAGEFAGFRVAAAVGYDQSEGEENLNSHTNTQISSNLGFSASLLHVASGLFLQGSHITFERGNTNNSSDSGTLWQVQGGIAKNWTGWGNTAFYGEYAQGNDLQRAFSQDAADVALSNTYTMWGLGVVQNIDAAAMEIYLAYRRHSLDRDADDNLDVQDIHIVFGGMRIGF